MEARDRSPRSRSFATTWPPLWRAADNWEVDVYRHRAVRQGTSLVATISMLCVTDAVAIEPDASVMGDVPATDDAPDTRTGKLAVTALMLLPGALVVFMGFNAGGYFPATPAVAALVLTQILLVRIMLSRHPFEGLAPASHRTRQRLLRRRSGRPVR